MTQFKADGVASSDLVLGYSEARDGQEVLAEHGEAYARYMRDAAGIERCAAYIRLENLDEDAAPLWSYLGFRLEIDRVNRSDRDPDYRAYYSPDDAALVGDLCAEDIARFGYSF